MTRERIKDFKEIVLPFFTNYLLKKNYENLGKSDAEEFEKDFSEIIELADKALEQQPCEDTISRQAAIDALRYAQHRFTVADEADGMGTVKWSEDVIYFAAAERVLSELPSVQPQPEEDCATCKHGYCGDRQCDNCRVRYSSHYEREEEHHGSY